MKSFKLVLLSSAFLFSSLILQTAQAQTAAVINQKPNTKLNYTSMATALLGVDGICTSLLNCMRGPNQAPGGPNCEEDLIWLFDFDGDGDVDLHDFAECTVIFGQ